ncbi:cytochrome c oxidase assembly protein [uncultured Cellulomonas sp.]|uniref:cytochrome c oxidase assembly protein n=1 Tax=uncultured Cellulomonas sp. TaxID=189682 RepID=UPI00263332B2|nr:cytochrome c oxidase assembly protein [uncultured Cellulomonas sp.]
MSHGSTAHVDPTGWLPAVALLTVLVGGYAATAVRVGVRTGRPWSAHRGAAFAAGALVLAFAVSPGVALVAPDAARAHMVQHVLLGMVAPLGVVLGAPLTLALAALPVRRRRTATALLRTRAVHVVSHPVTAAALHVGGLAALYLTPLYSRALAERWLHDVVLVHVTVAGCLFAWSLVGPERAARGPGPGWRVGVLVVASAAHGSLAKLLYARAPALPPGSPHSGEELRAAAQWMYYAGDVAEVALTVALLATWYRRGARHIGAPAVAGR